MRILLGGAGASKADGGAQGLREDFFSRVWASRGSRLSSLLFLFVMLTPRYSTYFAYSSKGTPNLFAIATCEGVSLTVLRPALALRLAGATA